MSTPIRSVQFVAPISFGGQKKSLGRNAVGDRPGQTGADIEIDDNGFPVRPVLLTTLFFLGVLGYVRAVRLSLAAARQGARPKWRTLPKWWVWSGAR